jgi:hypothetical protein
MSEAVTKLEKLLQTAAEAAGVTFRVEKKPLSREEKERALKLCARILAEMLLKAGEKIAENSEK